MRYVFLLCVGAVVFGGCSAIDDYQYCVMNQWRADRAWFNSYSWKKRWEVSSHYACGWRAGYYDVSTGGCGQPPAVPPHKYWSSWYQNEKGQDAISDWYAGFQEGATAAQSVGNDAWHPIPTGPTIPTAPVAWGIEGEVLEETLPVSGVQPVTAGPLTQQVSPAIADNSSSATELSTMIRQVPNELRAWPQEAETALLPATAAPSPQETVSIITKDLPKEPLQAVSPAVSRQASSESPPATSPTTLPAPVPEKSEPTALPVTSAPLIPAFEVPPVVVME